MSESVVSNDISENPLSRRQPKRFGVIGAGKFGTYHARQYVKRDGAVLGGVYDPDPKRGHTLAEDVGCPFFSDIDALINQVDGVSITSPAIFHYDAARKCLDAGIHTLVEKPIAVDLNHADQLIQLADEKGLTLQVGHQERYVFESFGLLNRKIAPLAIEGARKAPFNGRAMDVNVILDLMIHDLDLMHQVVSHPIVKVNAVGRRTHGPHADEVDTRMVLANGCDVRLAASRIAKTLDRSMKLIYPDGEIEIDFVNRTLKNTTPEKLVSPFEESGSNIAAFADPLGENIQDFIRAVHFGSAPKISGMHGRRALESALMITDNIEYID